jgi:hypothetical protein
MIPHPSIIQKPFSPLADSFCARGGDFSGSFVQSVDGFHPGSLNPIPISSYEF